WRSPNYGELVGYWERLSHAERRVGVSVSRVIGRPGDAVALRNGVLRINERDIARQLRGPVLPPPTRSGEATVEYLESFPSGRQINTYCSADWANGEEDFNLVLRDDEYLLLEDTRDFTSQRIVTEDDLIGSVYGRLLPIG